MADKGKGVEREKPSHSPEPAVGSLQGLMFALSTDQPHHQPSIDESDADDCSSQYVEDISEPASAGPIHIKGRGAEAPYIPSPMNVSVPLKGRGEVGVLFSVPADHLHSSPRLWRVVPVEAQLSAEF